MMLTLLLSEIGDKYEAVYGMVGIAIGAIGGIVVAFINNKGKTALAESKAINELTAQLTELNAKFDSLKLAFALVFDQYEREFKNEPDKMAMLKDLRKAFDL